MNGRSGGGLQGLLYAAEKHEVLVSSGTTSPCRGQAVRQAESPTSAGSCGSNTTLPSRKRPRAREDSQATESTPENGRDDSDNSNSGASTGVCQYDTCSKPARSGGRKFCRRHGEGRRCKTPGCSKVDVGGGSCRKHGGGRRCGAEGCMKTDVGGGFCVSHGGGRRCQSEGCAKGAQAGGVFCKSHGGGRRCRIEGCMTSAQSGADVLCIKHGGGKRCMVPGCQKLVRKNNRCTKHASEDSANAATSQATPVSVSASTAAKTAKAKAAVAATSAALAETTKTTRAPAAPAPIPRRRAASLSRLEAHDPPPSPTARVQLSPPKRREPAPSPRRAFDPHPFPDGSTKQSPSPAVLPQPLHEGDNSRGGYIGGRPFSSISSTSRGSSSPYFGPNAGVSYRGSLSAFHPPLAAFGGRVARAAPASGGKAQMQDGTARGTLGGVHDDVVSSSSEYSPPYSSVADQDQAHRYRDRLPGIDSLRSLSLDRRNGFSDGNTLACSMDPTQPPNYSAAAHLLSLGGSMPRDLPPGAMTSSARIGRSNASGDPLAMLGGGGVGSSPEQRLRTAHCLPPYRGNRFSDGVPERSPSLSPLPASLLVQPPPSALPTSYLPLPTARDPQSTTGSSGGVTSDTPDASPGAGSGVIPAKSPPRSAAAVASERSLEAASSPHPRLPPSSSAASTSSVAPSSGGKDSGAGQDSMSSSRPASHGECRSSPDPDAAAAGARSPEMTTATPAAAPPQKTSSCCGGRKAAASTAGGTRTAAANENSSRSCSTSPPAEQTSSFISLSVSGMRCMENCAQTVQRALTAVPGVRSVTMHFPTRTASVKVDPETGVSVGDLTSALDAIGFGSHCVASTTTNEPALEQDGVNAVWAIANALGLVDPGCAMAWGAPCSCGDDCQCINCPQHMKKVSHAVDLVLQAVDLSSAANPDSPPEKSQQPEQPQHQN
ncbi:unnamed protein product [Scytosiphon promiscuus]